MNNGVTMMTPVTGRPFSADGLPHAYTPLDMVKAAKGDVSEVQVSPTIDRPVVIIGKLVSGYISCTVSTNKGETTHEFKYEIEVPDNFSEKEAKEHFTKAAKMYCRCMQIACDPKAKGKEDQIKQKFHDIMSKPNVHFEGLFSSAKPRLVAGSKGALEVPEENNERAWRYTKNLVKGSLLTVGFVISTALLFTPFAIPFVRRTYRNVFQPAENTPIHSVSDYKLGPYGQQVGSMMLLSEFKPDESTTLGQWTGHLHSIMQLGQEIDNLTPRDFASERQVEALKEQHKILVETTLAQVWSHYATIVNSEKHLTDEQKPLAVELILFFSRYEERLTILPRELAKIRHVYPSIIEDIQKSVQLQGQSLEIVKRFLAQWPLTPDEAKLLKEFHHTQNFINYTHSVKNEPSERNVLHSLYNQGLDLEYYKPTARSAPSYTAQWLELTKHHNDLVDKIIKEEHSQRILRWKDSPLLHVDSLLFLLHYSPDTLDNPHAKELEQYQLKGMRDAQRLRTTDRNPLIEDYVRGHMNKGFILEADLPPVRPSSPSGVEPSENPPPPPLPNANPPEGLASRITAAMSDAENLLQRNKASSGKGEIGGPAELPPPDEAQALPVEEGVGKEAPPEPELPQALNAEEPSPAVVQATVARSEAEVTLANQLDQPIVQKPPPAIPQSAEAIPAPFTEPRPSVIPQQSVPAVLEKPDLTILTAPFTTEQEVGFQQLANQIRQNYLKPLFEHANLSNDNDQATILTAHAHLDVLKKYLQERNEKLQNIVNWANSIFDGEPPEIRNEAAQAKAHALNQFHNECQLETDIREIELELWHAVDRMELTDEQHKVLTKSTPRTTAENNLFITAFKTRMLRATYGSNRTTANEPPPPAYQTYMSAPELQQLGEKDLLLPNLLKKIDVRGMAIVTQRGKWLNDALEASAVQPRSQKAQDSLIEFLEFPRQTLLRLHRTRIVLEHPNFSQLIKANHKENISSFAQKIKQFEIMQYRIQFEIERAKQSSNNRQEFESSLGEIYSSHPSYLPLLKELHVAGVKTHQPLSKFVEDDAGKKAKKWLKSNSSTILVPMIKGADAFPAQFAMRLPMMGDILLNAEEGLQLPTVAPIISQMKALANDLQAEEKRNQIAAKINNIRTHLEVYGSQFPENMRRSLNAYPDVSPQKNEAFLNKLEDFFLERSTKKRDHEEVLSDIKSLMGAGRPMSRHRMLFELKKRMDTSLIKASKDEKAAVNVAMSALYDSRKNLTADNAEHYRILEDHFNTDIKALNFIHDLKLDQLQDLIAIVKDLRELGYNQDVLLNNDLREELQRIPNFTSNSDLGQKAGSNILPLLASVIRVDISRLLKALPEDVAPHLSREVPVELSNQANRAQFIGRVIAMGR